MKDSSRLNRRLWRRGVPRRLDFSIRGATRSAVTLVREPLKLLTRYILREQFGPLLFALSSLTALLLLQQVAKQFGNLVGKGLGWGVIGEFFLLSIPFIIAMTMPMGVLVAVLYAFSRLTAENEITALRASGISVMRLVRPAICFGAALGLLMLVFNDQVLPRSNHRLRTLQTDIARKKPTFALREQVINEVMPGKLFLRTSHIDESTDGMREVTIYNFDDPERRKTIYSDSGVMGMTPDQKDLQMTLQNGYMQQIPRDNLGELTRLYFRTDLVRVRGVGNRFEQTEKDDYKSEREMSVCEMAKGLEDGNQDLDQARATLANTLGAATHYLATGEQLPATKAPKPKVRMTAGGLYCKLVTPIFGNAAIADSDTTAAATKMAAAAVAPSMSPPSSGGYRAPSSGGAPPGGFRAPPSSGMAQRQSPSSGAPTTAGQAMQRAPGNPIPQLPGASAAGHGRLFNDPGATSPLSSPAYLLSSARADRGDESARARLRGHDEPLLGGDPEKVRARCRVRRLRAARRARGHSLSARRSRPRDRREHRGVRALLRGAHRRRGSREQAHSRSRHRHVDGQRAVHRRRSDRARARAARGGSARGGDFSELIDTVRTWFAQRFHRVGIRADRRRRVPA